MVRFAGFEAGSAICISNAERQILFTNDAHLKMLGRARDEVIGVNWQAWVPSDELDAIEPYLQAFWRDRRPYGFVSSMLSRDGTPRPFISRSSLIRGETREADLIFSELQSLESFLKVPEASAFACASFVRDITYELARCTGKRRFSDLTNALLDASASAERVIEMLAQVADELRVLPTSEDASVTDVREDA